MKVQSFQHAMNTLPPLHREHLQARPRAGEPKRFLGIDVGAETIKVVEVVRQGTTLTWSRRLLIEHEKEVGPRLRQALERWPWSAANGAAVTGRLARQTTLPAVPVKQAQAWGLRHLLGPDPVSAVSIGSHGFSILELREGGTEVFRENSRCSQGTGNFLRQLVGRFSLTIEEASALATPVEKPAVLSGRCPVILKTDMTHLANKGEDRAAILAGLFDAVCENVLVLLKAERSPKRVALFGGVARSERVRNTFAHQLGRLGCSIVGPEVEDAPYVEALGAALLAATQPEPVPVLEMVLRVQPPATLEHVPALRQWQSRVRRLSAPNQTSAVASGGAVWLGFDIGSTGSKVVALDDARREPVWEHYRATGGDPVGAAQALLSAFLESELAGRSIAGFGVTGSGREIVGSLLTACYGKDAVYVLNEIAAHATGARHYDPRVDTIFEIGGQDAKYIRLADGRVIDCAMNEACSAGTGSFIEEQGRKFAGIRDVRHLAGEAMAAEGGVSLGQHCSVFMAEVIDEAVAAGVSSPTIIAGLYDSVIQNYLNRVKGSRSVGQVIFCQGMPFASDALAAAVARQTGAEVIVPPNPGTVGALGIALLAQAEIRLPATTPIVAARFLAARVEGKDTFHCGATVGCGGAGNRCRIERLRTVVGGRALGFTWGGGCALHDKATRKRKLPDRAPDPFRQREELVQRLVAAHSLRRGRKRVALTDEFALKGLFPFFVTLLDELGFDLEPITHGDQADLKRGIVGANVPFCAPMQLYHGVAARMANAGADLILLPMLQSLAAVRGERHAVACPIVQASPDLLRWDLAALERVPVVSPVIRFGAGGLESTEFAESCGKLAVALGVDDEALVAVALERAKAAQRSFEAAALDLGARALAYCAEHHLTPVVVMGRPYTIYNPVLNSNVPAILREQGAIGIPVDCYPVEAQTPVFPDMYWGYGQRILRAAHQVRRTSGHYSLYCSNYACGPDSFNLHFYAHIMAGKPCAIIETDGHSGDAGTKTRIEAFLHCVSQDRVVEAQPAANEFGALQVNTAALQGMAGSRAKVLIPWMSDVSKAVAAALRGRGVDAECLPEPDRAALRIGRRHTSGKECLPMALTLGTLLRRLERAAADERFIYLMSSTYGPCRFGVYNLLNQIALKQLDGSKRVQIWSPRDTGYFDEFPAAFRMLMLSGIVGADLLNEMAILARADERRRGAVQETYEEALDGLLRLLERQAASLGSTAGALWQVTSGSLFGVRDWLAESARRLEAGRDGQPRPTVLLVGEIYVRSVPFANDQVAQKLSERGLRVRLAPVQEWLEYCDANATADRTGFQLGGLIGDRLQDRIRRVAVQAVDQAFTWAPRHSTAQILEAAQPYLRPDLRGEAVLTIGGPLCAWRDGQIDGVVSAGPHECMPNKIAESQFFHLAEDEGMPSLTLPLNGDPTDPAVLDTFAFEIHQRWRKQHATGRVTSRVDEIRDRVATGV